MMGTDGGYFEPISLGSSFVINRTLKHIEIGRRYDLDEYPYFTLTGWQEFFECFTVPDSALEVLEIEESEVNNEVAILLFIALRENKSLRKLNMSCNPRITSAGWIQCFQIALDSEFILEDIDLSKNSIDDEGVAMLTGLLFNSKSISSLWLHDNYSIANHGWSTPSSELLPNSASKLKTLRIGVRNLDDYEFNVEDIINDDVFTNFANSLATNTNLKSLIVGDVCDISRNGWDHIVSAMCDALSIERRTTQITRCRICNLYFVTLFQMMVKRCYGKKQKP